MDKRLTRNQILTVSKYHLIDYLLAAKGKKVTLPLEQPSYHNLKQSKLTSPLKMKPENKYILI